MDERSSAGKIGTNMILGIDFGKKNIGLATSEGNFASPYEEIRAGSWELGIEKIKKIVDKLGVEKVVVGVSEGKSRKQAEGFGKKLGSVLGLPVEFEDETLSTWEGGDSHSKAAAIILQRWLDKLL